MTGLCMSVVRINNWAVVAPKVSIGQLSPPPVHLRGVVIGHPNWQDGSDITTSHITHRHGWHLVSTNGTHYELGFANPDYEARFPNARELLLRRFPEKMDEETVRCAGGRSP
jgi:hypothetical protein